MSRPTSQKLLTGPEVAETLGFSLRHWQALNAQQRTPAPIRIGGRSVRWLAVEIDRWLAAGCPDRAEFEAMRGAVQ